MLNLLRRFLGNENKRFTSLDLNLIRLRKKINPQKEALKIAIIYSLISIIWVILSDEALSHTINNPQIYKYMNMFKGCIYILITVTVIYSLIYRKMMLLKNALDRVHTAYKELSIAYDKTAAVEDELRLKFKELEEHRNALIESNKKQVIIQEKLRREKILSDNVINDVSIIIAIWNADGTIKRLNPYGETVSGYKCEELIGENWLERLIPKQNKVYMSTVFEKVSKGEILRNHESQLIRKDGKPVNIIWNSNVLHEENSQVKEIISFGTDITEFRKMEEKLNSLAYYDVLTKLPNRFMFQKKMGILLKEKQNKLSKFALIFMDIDNFKYINDTLGHLSGDKLLKNIANILMENIIPPNFISRLGGDEFAIVIDNVEDNEDISIKIKALIKNLRKPWIIEEQEFFISFSMGIAVYPQDGKDLITLLKKADTAMFNIKEKGKDNYCFYSDNMEEKTLEHINMLNELRRAIDKKEFTLYYQPQINLTTGKIIGVEALIRWIHPKRGFIPPIEFISIAEQTGYIHNIEEWVFKTAFKQKKEWDEKGYSNINMSINMSGETLARNNVVSDIKKILVDNNMNCTNLQIEITETSFMKKLDVAIKNIEYIRNMGIKVSLDDFGTGYSSLTYLKKLPIDIVKIDRQFIKGIINQHEEEIIVQSIIQLVHGLNMEVVAEGIETEEQLEFLKKYKCDIGQGYLFSKPLPPDEIEKIIEDDYKVSRETGI
ncbi:putative bifunctional diguanylate cyclase/phosphodiesterase [Clostridium brassicae]|uniref:EAL domain-containing protein n=1 Tax=Clostridium brassicae TaxID=2999072 RepID=A0ABT4D8U4_9CLOT|nr:EAL domain-containing protein [Clostridium brassicae]MCY6957454.1 EAL domain-containing protein [Clostridium brassicae]